MSVTPFIALVALVMGVTPVPIEESLGRGVTLCDIVTAPARFDGTVVSFHSHIESDGTHGAVLSEKGCKRGIVPARGHADWSTMDRILDTIGLPGTVDKAVTATWTGTIHVQGNVISLTVDRIDTIAYRLSDKMRHSGVDY